MGGLLERKYHCLGNIFGGETLLCLVVESRGFDIIVPASHCEVSSKQPREDLGDPNARTGLSETKRFTEAVYGVVTA